MGDQIPQAVRQVIALTGVDGLATGDPEVAATTERLLLAHLTWNSKRLLGAMVLDHMDTESLSTRAEFPDCCQRLVNGLD